MVRACSVLQAPGMPVFLQTCYNRYERGKQEKRGEKKRKGGASMACFEVCGIARTTVAEGGLQPNVTYFVRLGFSLMSLTLQHVIGEKEDTN